MTFSPRILPSVNADGAGHTALGHQITGEAMTVPEGYEHLLTIAEAAEFLGTTERFPRRLVEQRRVEFVKVGRAVRFRQQALVEYLARQTVMPVELQRRRSA